MLSWRGVLAVAAVVPLLAGCTGKDAARAEQLLQAANQAQANVSSESFSAHLTVESKGQQLQLAMTGGGYLKGAHAGDVVLDMKLSAPVALPFGDVRMAKVGNVAWLELDGKRTPLPAGSLDSSTGGDPLLGALDLTRYVKDVAVDGGQLLNGRQVTKITGVLDTASLVQELASLGGAGSAAGLPDLSGNVSDTRVVVYLDDTTHLLVAALADFTVHEGGNSAAIHLDLAVDGVNEPVALPAA